MTKAEKLFSMLEAKKFTWDGKYINTPDKEICSIPNESEREVILFDHPGNRETFMVYRKRNGKIYGDTGEYDKIWKNEKEFVNWLNKEKLKYVGYDKI